MPEPTDEDFEAQLAATPAEAWAELRVAVDGLTPGPHAEWKGGTKDADGVITMPWVELDAGAERLVRALGAVGAVIPYDWSAWIAGREDMDLGMASPADVCRWLTAAVRADRFNEGTVASLIEEGRISAAARRLLEWRDGPRPD